jgi:hypothetical protein
MTLLRGPRGYNHTILAFLLLFSYLVAGAFDVKLDDHSNPVYE